MLQIRGEDLAGEAKTEYCCEKFWCELHRRFLPDPKISTLTNKCDNSRPLATAHVPFASSASPTATPAYSKNDSYQTFLILIHCKSSCYACRFAAAPEGGWHKSLSEFS
ncbi:hypothetical protein OU5_3806 [Pseudomonas mandelii JR-1]|uniref:Uncharacterized protein n=1 Tax=Pseudomonas mandelii JR-1 TaxID=1147786 RepID=A0A024EE85_9PSED|nr:hypothetical protein OU5_3806 [Pseudomonas mandelii JR-1]